MTVAHFLFLDSDEHVDSRNFRISVDKTCDYSRYNHNVDS